MSPSSSAILMYGFPFLNALEAICFVFSGIGPRGCFRNDTILSLPLQTVPRNRSGFVEPRPARQPMLPENEYTFMPANKPALTSLSMNQALGLENEIANGIFFLSRLTM